MSEGTASDCTSLNSAIVIDLITKTYLYNFDTLKPHALLYSKTGIYRGIHYLLISARNIDCG